MGGIRHPLLADFWPHGGVAKTYGLFNEAAGIVNRTLLIIDPDGIVRHTEAHQRTLPDPAAALSQAEGTTERVGTRLSRPCRGAYVSRLWAGARLGRAVAVQVALSSRD